MTISSSIYYLPTDIIENFNAINNEKNFYDQTIYSDIKQFKEIRKLTTGQDEDYTIGCFLDYKYMKNYLRLTSVDLSTRKELDDGLKSIQQIELVE